MTEHNWDDVAQEVLEAIESKLEKTVRKASESIYEDVHGAILDNLSDNLRFNIQSRVDVADRQARHDRIKSDKDAIATSILRSALFEIKRLVAPLATQGEDNVWRPAELILATANKAIAQSDAVFAPPSQA